MRVSTNVEQNPTGKKWSPFGNNTRRKSRRSTIFWWAFWQFSTHASESFSTLKAATIESNHISLASESIRLVVAVFYLRCILCEALRTEKKTMEKVSRSMEQTHKMHRKPIYKHLCRMATHKKWITNCSVCEHCHAMWQHIVLQFWCYHAQAEP